MSHSSPVNRVLHCFLAIIVPRTQSSIHIHIKYIFKQHPVRIARRAIPYINGMGVLHYTLCVYEWLLVTVYMLK